MSNYVDFAALGQVLLVSLGAGVGLVALYALGLVGLARGREDPDSETRAAATLLAVVCFAVVAAGLALGLWVILKS